MILIGPRFINTNQVIKYFISNLYHLIMDLKKITKIIPSIIAIIVVLGFFGSLIKNINYVKIPNSDFFQYINEGRQYLKFKLPINIGAPPLSPILICFFAKFFTFAEYPELLSAHLINIICSSLILLNIFLIFKKTKPWIGLFTIILLATNKIYFTNSLNITNEVVYGYFLTLIILLYSKKQYKMSYLLSGLTFLVRYEAIIIPIIIFGLELFKKTKRFKISNLAIAFLPIIIFSIILNFHSEGGSSIFQNHYITEIIYGKNNIPNLQPIKSFLDFILSDQVNSFIFSNLHVNNYPTLPGKITNIVFPLIILILCLVKIIPKKNSITTKIIFLTLLGHTFFISLFPNFSMRYLFPIFWIIYLVIINRKNKVITIILTIILLTINIITIRQNSFYDESQNKSEYRLVAEWIKQQNFSKQTYIVVFEPFIIKYYLHQQQNIIFNDENIFDFKNEKFNQLLDGCHNNTLCVIQSLYNKKPNDSQFFFISTTASSPEGDVDKLSDQFYVTQVHLKTFRDQNLSENDKKQLKLITELKQDKDHWAKVYQYQSTTNSISP